MIVRKQPLTQSWDRSDLADAKPDTFSLLSLDSVLEPASHAAVYEFLRGPGWLFGWKSNPQQDTFSFWHKHFAGAIDSDYVRKKGCRRPLDCAPELKRNAPLLHAFWRRLGTSVFKEQILVRCYANAHAYGGDGTIHKDSPSPTSHTAIYYPHKKWMPDWAGETVFFNKAGTDIEAAIYPKPNRLVIFPGTTPHVARGVARSCPVLRMTLMFKTERKHA